MPFNNYFEQPKPPTRITVQELIKEMMVEKDKHNRAVELATTDLVDVFCEKNPDYPHKEEFFQLFSKIEPRTPAEEIRTEELLRQMGSTPESLRAKIMQSYANLNNYTIVQEG